MRCHVEDIKLIFAQNLISLRKQMKLTQAEFAEKINYSDKAVSKWERGESIPDVSVLKSIGDFFGVTVDFLITEHLPEEKVEHKTNYAKIVKNKNHFLISAITIAALLVCALTVFVSLQSANPDNLWINLECCFILPLPIYFVVLLIFSSLWAKKRVWKILFTSLLVWSLVTVSFFIVWLSTGSAYPLVFIVGVPAQIIIFMSFGIIDLKTLKIKTEKHDQNNS